MTMMRGVGRTQGWRRCPPPPQDTRMHTLEAQSAGPESPTSLLQRLRGDSAEDARLGRGSGEGIPLHLV